MSLLHAPDPRWSDLAEEETKELIARIPTLVGVQHIGSTSVPGLPAKPIIDLLPIFPDAATQAASQELFEAMGYEWLGEFGLPGRAYVRKSDPESGSRLFQAHCYVQGDPGVIRHVAFRDALRENASLRAAYISVKAACAARHPEGGEHYGNCKSDWINKTEARAVTRFHEKNK